MEWVRRRHQLGLSTHGCPWEDESEDTWSLLRTRAPGVEEMHKPPDAGLASEGLLDEVPAEVLADEDSKLVDVGWPLRVRVSEEGGRAVQAACDGEQQIGEGRHEWS